MGSSSTAGHPGNTVPARVRWHKTRWSSFMYILSLRDVRQAKLGKVKRGRKGKEGSSYPERKQWSVVAALLILGSTSILTFR